MGDWVFRYRGFLMAPFGLLILLFGKPTFLSFTAGALIALLGEVLRFWAVGHAGQTTRKSTLDAPRLVREGPYGYVRHPLYLGNSLMGAGGLIIALGRLSPIESLLLFFAFVFFYGTVYGILMPVEEEFLVAQFGETYHDYRKQVPRFFPTRKKFASEGERFNFSIAWKSEIHTFVPFLIVVAILAFKIR